MSHVFVVDTDTQPLTPVHPGRARLLLKAGKRSSMMPGAKSSGQRN